MSPAGVVEQVTALMVGAGGSDAGGDGELVGRVGVGATGVVLTAEATGVGATVGTLATGRAVGSGVGTIKGVKTTGATLCGDWTGGVSTASDAVTAGLVEADETGVIEGSEGTPAVAAAADDGLG